MAKLGRKLKEREFLFLKDKSVVEVPAEYIEYKESKKGNRVTRRLAAEWNGNKFSKIVSAADAEEYKKKY